MVRPRSAAAIAPTKLPTLADVDKPTLGRPPERLRVTIRRRLRVGEHMEEDVTWPKGWPLPDAGAIVSGHTVAGWVEHVEMDIVAQRIIVVLR